MYTLMFLTKRLPELSVEEFREHYRDTHYALASKMPGLVSYQQSVIHDDLDGWGEPGSALGYDALSLYTFETAADAKAGFASAEGVATDADTPTFMSWDDVLWMPVEFTQRFERDAS